MTPIGAHNGRWGRGGAMSAANSGRPATAVRGTVNQTRCNAYAATRVATTDPTNDGDFPGMTELAALDDGHQAAGSGPALSAGHAAPMVAPCRRIATGLRGSRFKVMTKIVLRVRLIGGERMDITFDDPDAVNEDELVEHIIATLAQDSGVLRTRHGDRLVALFGRGVAAIEVAPRGAVL